MGSGSRCCRRGWFWPPPPPPHAHTHTCTHTTLPSHNSGNQTELFSIINILSSTVAAWLAAWMSYPESYWNPWRLLFVCIIVNAGCFIVIGMKRIKWVGYFFLSLGDMCCAQFTIDNQWYRACIKTAYSPAQPNVVPTLENNLCVEVQYIDYGNSEWLPLSRWIWSFIS